jgi:hypothetical protein
LVENIQRHDLDPIEIALSYQRLIDTQIEEWRQNCIKLYYYIDIIVNLSCMVVHQKQDIQTVFTKPFEWKPFKPKPKQTKKANHHQHLKFKKLRKKVLLIILEAK